MNFDFKNTKDQNEEVLQKKPIIPKVNKLKNFTRGLHMNFSLRNIPSAFWSIAGLIVAVVAMHFKIENAAWAIPVSCLLYYTSNQVLPFAVMSIAITGMALGIPQLVFLMIFSVITMFKWSELF